MLNKFQRVDKRNFTSSNFKHPLIYQLRSILYRNIEYYANTVNLERFLNDGKRSTAFQT